MRQSSASLPGTRVKVEVEVNDRVNVDVAVKLKVGVNVDVAVKLKVGVDVDVAVKLKVGVDVDLAVKLGVGQRYAPPSCTVASHITTRHGMRARSA